ncbi:MAG: gliding motility protein GldL [Paludibacteraceae bacterium]|nr:gliding motility protein GldL [Paludibacteraceae bacterium]
MATEKANQSFGARFFHWYESYDGKNVVNIIYSAGASVVIIGALFKILHWPGASQVLMIGMFTEAFLFLIGTLEHPHPEFHWENVFPQLLEYGTKPELLEEKSKQPRPTLLGAGVAGAPVAAASGVAVAGAATAAEPSAKAPGLKDEDFKALKEGIGELAKTATQFAELGKVAQSGVKLNEKLVAAEAATSEYAAKLANVGIATDNLSQAASGLSGAYTQIGADMKSVAEETKAYKAGVEQVGKSIAALNSVYELQLQAVNAQTAAQKEAVAAAKEAAEAQVAFAQSTKQLQKQVADLNGIYGNMLNALA